MFTLAGINVPQVEFPVFQGLPQLPTPLGTLYYSQVYMIWIRTCVQFLIPVKVFKLVALW